MVQVTECKISISILRYDLMGNGVYFVPTCHIFVGYYDRSESRRELNNLTIPFIFPRRMCNNQLSQLMSTIHSNCCGSLFQGMSLAHWTGHYSLSTS